MSWGRKMKKLLFAALMFLAGIAPAFADNCSAYPYTLLNGVTADANQVMADFNSILSCGNSNLLARNNNLSDLQSASTSRTNLGLGSAATAAASSGTGTVAAVSAALNGDLSVYTDNTGTLGDSGIAGSNVLTKTGNLAGLNSTSTSRTNLGLGSISIQNVTYSTSGPSGSANTGDLWLEYVP